LLRFSPSNCSAFPIRLGVRGISSVFDDCFRGIGPVCDDFHESFTICWLNVGGGPRIDGTPVCMNSNDLLIDSSSLPDDGLGSSVTTAVCVLREAKRPGVEPEGKLLRLILLLVVLPVLNKPRKSGRKVASEVATIPRPGSTADQMAMRLASMNQVSVAVARRGIYTRRTSEAMLPL
jgi:hypothetical protein